MTLTLLRARLFFVRLRVSVHLAYSTAILLRVSTLATWELFKVTMRGVWGIK